MERDLPEAIVYGSDTMPPPREDPIQVVATGGDSLDTHFALYIFIFRNDVIITLQLFAFIRVSRA